MDIITMSGEMNTTKRIICFVVFLVLFLPGFSLAQEMTYTIKGQLDNLGSQKVYLVDIGDAYYFGDKDIAIDSCVSHQGSFNFQGHISEPALYAIKIPELTQQYLLFVLDACEVTIQGDADTLFRAQVEGSLQHDLYREFARVGRQERSLLNQIVDSMYVYKNIDTPVYNTYYDKYTTLQQQLESKEHAFIRQYPNAFVSMRKINEMTLRKIPQDTIDRYFSLLSEDLKKSRYGQVLSNRIKTIRNENGRRIMPHFEATDLFDSARFITNNSYKGKILIIDFWATWCIPCIEQLPELHDIKNKYNDDVSILSVSLDKDQNRCKEFIHANDMDWDHICDGLVGRGDMVVDFNITSIPRVVVCDRDGLVIYDSKFTDEDLSHFINKYISMH